MAFKLGTSCAERSFCSIAILIAVLLPHCGLRLQAKTMHTHSPVRFHLFRCAASLRTSAY